MRRERAGIEHVETGERESLGAADGNLAGAVAIAPQRTGAGIEQHADDGQIELGTRPRHRIGPARGRRDCRPAVLAVDHEVAPARMKRHLAERIRPTHRGQHEVDRGIEPRQVNPEMWQPVLEPHHQQPMRAFAHRLSRQQ